MQHKDYLLYNYTAKEWRLANGIYEFDSEYGHILKEGCIRPFSHFGVIVSVFNKVTFQPENFFEVIKYYKN